MYVCDIYLLCSQTVENNLFTILVITYQESEQRGNISPAQQEISDNHFPRKTLWLSFNHSRDWFFFFLCELILLAFNFKPPSPSQFYNFLLFDTNWNIELLTSPQVPSAPIVQIHLQRNHYVHHIPFILLIEQFLNNLIICPQHSTFSYYKDIPLQCLLYQPGRRKSCFRSPCFHSTMGRVKIITTECLLQVRWWMILYLIFNTIFWYRYHYMHLKKKVRVKEILLLIESHTRGKFSRRASESPHSGPLHSTNWTKQTLNYPLVFFFCQGAFWRS